MKEQQKNRIFGPPSDYSKASGGGVILAKAIGQTPQAQVARELGVTPAFINHLIRGRKRPSISLAIRIRDIYGVAIEEWIKDAS